MKTAHVRTGLEVLKATGFAPLKGHRVAVLTNPTAVDGRFRHLLDLLGETDVNVVRVFGPEHGLFSTVQDMVGVSGDPHRFEVVSLYGDSFDSLRPREDQLRDIDLLVFDIQDIGSRYYTYAWTLALAMETAKKTGTRVMVLDRPNPINATTFEGGGIEPPLRSFVGYHELPNRTGLTVGEVATFVAQSLGGVDLDVVRMEGYRRGMWGDETGVPWVYPSPNMPTLETALVYPGQVLLEGTNLSEGRGTTLPFEVFGAPFVDGHRLAAALETENLPGVVFRPLRFQPTFQKWAGKDCGGLQMHVTDRNAFLPYRTSLAVLRHARALWPREFAWRTEIYEFRDDVPAVDLLTGQTRVRELIDAAASVSEIAEFAESTGGRARANRRAALLYSNL